MAVWGVFIFLLFIIIFSGVEMNYRESGKRKEAWGILKAILVFSFITGTGVLAGMGEKSIGVGVFTSLAASTFIGLLEIIVSQQSCERKDQKSVFSIKEKVRA